LEFEVIKLGGSILTDRKTFNRAVEIVENELSRGILPVCVVSAMKGVTDRIITALNKCLDDENYDPRRFIEELFEDHLVALPYGVEADMAFEEEFEKILHVLFYVKSSGELNDSVYAYAVSRGENLSSRVLSLHLEAHGIKNTCFYGEDLMTTDENNLEGAVELEKTTEQIKEVLRPSIEEGTVPIIAGFAGRSINGSITILGRGGTDDTAVNIAYGLGVKRAVKYVMEEGIMSIDPKFITMLKGDYPEIYAQFYDLPEPHIIPYLSYVEASELLREERTKVVHYKVLDPLMKGKIELQIKNYYDEESEGTIIGTVEEAVYTNDEPRPKAISYQRGLAGVRFLPSQSITPTEVYGKVFSKLSEEAIDVRYVSTSGYQLSFLMPEEDQEKALKALQTLDIAYEVTPLKGKKGTFSVVGSEMRGMKGFFSRLTGVLARHGVNIEQATQPNSENIIRFSIDDDDLPMAVAAVYNEFFKGEIKR
jgi:aspartate kinase